MSPPYCSLMDCSSVGRADRTVSPAPELAFQPASQWRAACVEELPPHREEKSQQRERLECRLEHIDSRLARQQEMLEKVVQLQQELRAFMADQQEKIELKIGEISSDGAVGFKPLASVACAVSEGSQLSPTNTDKTKMQNHDDVFGSRKPPRKQRKKPEEDSNILRVHSRPSRLTPLPNQTTCLGRLASSPFFEVLMGFVIVANFIVSFFELEWRGWQTAHILGDPYDPEWTKAEGYFHLADKMFNVVYLLELITRVHVMRWKFFRDALNVVDTAVVAVSSFDSFVLDPIVQAGSSETLDVVRSIIRILRAFRVVRFIRILRFMSMFSALRVLIKTLSMSLDSLIWSMVVLAFIILSAAMMMVQLTSPYLDDGDNPHTDREWVYYHFGSALRASYSMFEATFSAKWATHLARPLMDDINPWFSVFWMIYTVTVNFAVIRIVAALFLKQTMAVAAIDQEQKAVERLKERDKTMGKLREIFKMGDQTADGVLHQWEFDEMMDNPEVLRMFEELELEQLDLYLLFDLLAADDGVADQEEFLNGAMKLQNHARTVDMIQVLHEQTVMRRSIEVIKDGIERVDTVLHPLDPWKAKRDNGEFIFNLSAHKVRDEGSVADRGASESNAGAGAAGAL